MDFSGKSNISDVYIEDGISEIGTEAFYNFSDLERIRIPDSVTRIGGWAFSGCRALQRFEIPSGVSALGSGVFENCDNLKELYISYNVREITVSEDSDTGMFYGINNLEEIVVDERNEYYSSDDGVLYDKEKKKVVFCPQGKREMDILETAVEIGKCAFYNCKNILTLTIPDGVVDIGDNAFYGCEKLENAVMPDTVKSIGYGAFYNCRSLKNMELPSGLTWIKDRLFSDCSNLANIKMPLDLMEIGACAFDGCISLKEIEIPNGVDRIGEMAFRGCDGINEIIIPDTVTEIGSGAFEGCENITIMGETGSEAEKYAQKYNIKFQAIEGDSHINETEFVYPTCTKDGKITIFCPNCDYAYTIRIPAAGHKYSDWMIVEKPTIFKRGLEQIRCVTCGEVLKEKEIDRLKSSVMISKKNLKLKVGQSKILKIRKQSDLDQISKWTTSSKKIVSVNKKTGKIKALKKGKANITVIMKSGCKATCRVTVK